jgi:DNA-binding GntR family transcriptional regulator
MEQEAAEGAGLAETDRAFHATLYRGLDNVLLSEVLEAFWDAFHRVQRDLVDVPQDPRVTCRQHREILDAVRSGDSLRAEEAIRDHFGNVRVRLSTSGAPRQSETHGTPGPSGTTGAPPSPEPHPRHNERV